MRKSLLMTLLLLVACSIASPLYPALAQSGLSALLNQVPDSDATRTVIWYGAPGDLAATLNVGISSLNDLNAMDTTVRRTYLLETGAQMYFSSFSGLADAAGWQQKYGINSFAISRELTVGTGANRFGILQGSFDAGAIGNALAALGYQASSEANATVYRSPDANTELPAVAIKSDGLLVAQPDQIAQLLTPAQTLGADANFAAIAAVLEGTTSGALISSVMYDGAYLTGTVFGRDLGSQIASMRGQLGLDQFPLPTYNAAGIGYRFDGNQRYWVIALAYSDAGAAQQAAAALQSRLPEYTSLSPRSLGVTLFQGWQVQVNVQQAAGVAVAVAVLNAQADIPWAETMNNRDIGFLAN